MNDTFAFWFSVALIVGFISAGVSYTNSKALEATKEYVKAGLVQQQTSKGNIIWVKP